MQATVVGVNADTLFIEFPLSPIFYDGRINRWSTELAQFESKTKQDYEWRRDKLAMGAKDFECEVHDKSTWNKSTILEIKSVNVAFERDVLMAYCGLRVYRDIPNSLRKDDKGSYEGWSNKFDEWVPIYSPRIQAWGSKIGVIEEQDLEDGLDDLVGATDEFQRVYAVPRLNTCTSALYLRYINIFGNEGGFSTIIDLLQNSKEDAEGLNI